MRVVLKISGKYVNPFDTPLVTEYASIIGKLAEKHEIAVVVGGGTPARKYIDLAPRSKSIKDIIGIRVARLNAFLLASHIPSAVKVVPKSAEEFLELWDPRKVIVVGGFQPGQSTNAVSLIVAELIEADMVINATTVDGVYDKPPNLPGAKRFEKIKADELMKILEGEGWSNEPGRYELMDSLALQIAKRSNIPIAVVYGGKPSNVMKAIEERKWGTLILP